ncbi:hypothetical protein VHEMI01452 [[Torrubiella] hemipterigena]|uniref:Serine-rich protein n=1 Tax=[Torrubiella] hemipterigena TaxID=1531966 RepID=A0A0A1T4T5_9HYPO|nr:hypothetical protein VHEMI01452 [[Torrubiella] hemipterigena]
MPYKVSRQPLKERTKSESNQASIRVVPYSPPRISDGYGDTSSNWAEDCRRSTISASEKPQPSLNGSIDWEQRNIVRIGSESSLSLASGTRTKRSSSRRPSTASSSASGRRSKKFINVHPDKTFSVIPQPGDDSPLSPCMDSSVHLGTDEPQVGSSSVPTYDEATKPLPALPTPLRIRDTSSSSPWNYQFMGGVRKVYPVTPTTAPSAKPNRQPGQPRKLPSAASLQSSYAGSEDSDTTNVYIYRGDMSLNSSMSFVGNDAALDGSSLSASQYRKGATSSKTGDFLRYTSEMDENHTMNYGVRPAFSKESLIVAPLRTRNYKEETRATQQSTQEDTLRNYVNDSIYESTTASARNPSEFASGALFPDGVEMDPLLGHFWSAPLSTIFSESEEGSERLSRSLSPLSTDMLDIKHSKLNKSDNYLLDTQSIDVPPAVHHRNSAQHVHGNDKATEKNNECDETADVLTELTTLHDRRIRSQVMGTSREPAMEQRPSSSDKSSRNQALPSWARVYYKSGNSRQLLNKGSLESIGNRQSDVANDQTIYDVQNDPEALYIKTKSGMNKDKKKHIYPEIGWIHTIKKQTSSIWSPHLKPDKRASGFKTWEAPADIFTSIFPPGWRNIQVPLFICGFILPPAWILAACLPLPPRDGTGSPYCIERKYFANSKAYHSYETAMLAQQTACHNRARWWRSLNRIMAVVGILITGAYIALIILGVKQPWASS